MWTERSPFPARCVEDAERARSRASTKRRPDATGALAAIALRRARASTTLTHPTPSRDLPSLEQKADETMLKFMKDLQEVRRRWTAKPRDARPPRGPIEAAFPRSFVFGHLVRRIFQTRRRALPLSLDSPSVPR